MFTYSAPAPRRRRCGRRPGDGRRGRRRHGRSRLRRPSTGASSPQAQADMADFRAATARPASTPRASRATSPGASARAPRTCGTPRSAASPRSARPAPATRWSATARKLQVRDDNHMRWGRYNTRRRRRPARRGNWLDSNDNRGIKWRIKGVGQFNAIGFFVTDVADVGGKFSIKVGETLYRDLADGDASSRTATSTSCASCSSEAVDKLTDPAQHDIARRRLRRRRRWSSARRRRCRCRRRRRCS